jgi:hypothetical protein
MIRFNSMLLAAAMLLLPVRFGAQPASAESAKHAINTKGTGGNNGKGAFTASKLAGEPDRDADCVDSGEASKGINQSGISASQPPVKHKSK